MRDIKHVVIIDDSAYKVKDIENAVYGIYPDAERHVFDTANEGLRYLSVTRLDDIKAAPDTWLLLTDMQMPMMKGTGIDRKAGRHVLDQMHRHMLLHEGVRVPTLVISSEKQDTDWLMRLFDGCLGCIVYSPFVSLKSQLRSVLEPDM